MFGKRKMTFVMGPISIRATPEQYNSYLRVEKQLDNHQAITGDYSSETIARILVRQSWRDLRAWKKFYMAYKREGQRTGFVETNGEVIKAGGYFVPAEDA